MLSLHQQVDGLGLIDRIQASTPGMGIYRMFSFNWKTNRVRYMYNWFMGINVKELLNFKILESGKRASSQHRDDALSRALHTFGLDERAIPVGWSA